MGRIILASNRLPVSIKRDAKNEWILSKSSGGLVSALESLSYSSNCIWIGWPGISIVMGSSTEIIRGSCRRDRANNFIEQTLHRIQSRPSILVPGAGEPVLQWLLKLVNSIFYPI